MKYLLGISTILFFCTSSFAQSNYFELTYGNYVSCGLLKDIRYPLISIKNDSLNYTYIQITSKYRLEKWGSHNENTDTLWLYDTITKYVKFREASKDSIINIANALHDTLIVGLRFSPGDFDDYILTLKYDNTRKLDIKLST